MLSRAEFQEDAMKKMILCSVIGLFLSTPFARGQEPVIQDPVLKPIELDPMMPPQSQGALKDLMTSIGVEAISRAVHALVEEPTSVFKTNGYSWAGSDAAVVGFESERDRWLAWFGVEKRGQKFYATCYLDRNAQWVASLGTVHVQLHLYWCSLWDSKEVVLEDKVTFKGAPKGKLPATASQDDTYASKKIWLTFATEPPKLPE
jgi:hypothetical protein